MSTLRLPVRHPADAAGFDTLDEALAAMPNSNRAVGLGEHTHHICWRCSEEGTRVRSPTSSAIV
jgi:hypothetical protein